MQVRDVTDRLALEARIQRAQRAEALGHMAGGLAHDLNNALTSVSVNAELIGEMLRNGVDSSSLQEIRGMVARILESAGAAEERVANLLLFAQKQVVRPTEVTVSNVLLEMRDELEVRIPDGVSFDLDLSPDIPDVRADEDHVRTVVRELVSNAAEACRDRGSAVQLTLDSQVPDREFTYSWLPEDSDPGRLVVLTVEDDGEGMDPATLERAFDPSFSTRFTGRGLGLAAVLGIVGSSGWAIHAWSSPGEGSSVSVFIPPIPPSVGRFDARGVAESRS